MKKFFLFVIVILLFNPVALAYYGAGDLVPSNPTNQEQTTKSIFVGVNRDSFIKNKPPTITLNYPSGLQVVNGNLVEFSWSYKDLEGDSQLSYQLELDDDPRFLSPLSYYGLSETKRKIYILNGDRVYYWRVKSKDDLGWGDFSDIESFYLDLSKKLCEDGTPYSQCSNNDFRYCDNGELNDNCQACGCPVNSVCTLSGTCVQKTCLDGTQFGFCGLKQPKFCQNGELKEVCSLCGCPDGKECGVDGSCSNVILKEENQKISLNLEQSSFISRFVNFLKSFYR